LIRAICKIRIQKAFSFLVPARPGWEEQNQRLLSQDFLTEAPQQVVERERQKKMEFELSLKKIVANLEQLKSP
jgi:valyl-tRNA synthetase